MHITAQARLRNDLYCVEWDVKLYYTIPYHTGFCSVSDRPLYVNCHWNPFNSKFLQSHYRHRITHRTKTLLLVDFG